MYVCMCVCVCEYVYCICIYICIFICIYISYLLVCKLYSILIEKKIKKIFVLKDCVYLLRIVLSCWLMAAAVFIMEDGEK